MTRIPDLAKKRALHLVPGDVLERLITLANAFQFMEVKGGGKLTIAGEKAVLEAGSGGNLTDFNVCVGGAHAVYRIPATLVSGE